MSIANVEFLPNYFMRWTMSGAEAYDRVQELKRKKGIKSDREVERRANATNGTLRNLKNGINIRSSTLTAVADVLDSTTAYILNGVPAQDNEESERQDFYAQFFNGLSRLNERNRKKVLDYIEDLLQAQQAP